MRDSDICHNCEIECDTIVHRLYDCETLSQIITTMFTFLKTNCNQSYSVSMIDFLFGKSGGEYLALNHTLLELKKNIFYSTTEDLNSPSFCELFFNKLRKLIIKEKRIFTENNKYEKFCEKWKDFTSIYDFRGPDVEPV